jgi:TRAP-type C4-dicarboxylate transport system permease large subunit
MVVLMITGAVMFGRFLTITRLPFELAEWAISLHLPNVLILMVVFSIYLVGGCLMDGLGFLVVTIPIFFPLGEALGYDPIWFTVMITLVTTIGAVTPPVGVNVYIVKGLCPDVTIQTIFRGVSVFLISYVVCLALIFVFPNIALYLVHALMRAY